jgi:CheY-like chemotaxis protein
MGGSLQVDSVPGEGSTFTFTAVLQRINAAQGHTAAGRQGAAAEAPTGAHEQAAGKPDRDKDASAQSAGSAAESPPAGVRATAAEEQEHTPLSILLVEDNAVNKKLAAYVLEKAGHRVTAAANGLDALDRLEESDFDLILMDVQMPEMDGIEATTKIRSHPNKVKAHIPIIAMTAHALRGDRERFLEAGMDDYIAKPIDIRQFVKTIEKIFEKEHDA